MRSPLFQTRITEMLGIRPPILCGGMGPGVSEATYVAAVVNAGGMGFIVSSGFPDPDQFREELWIHRQYKDLLVSSDGTDSVIVKTGLRQHHRVLNNDSAKAVAAIDAMGTSDFERYRPHVMGTLTSQAYRTGDSSIGMLDYGPSAVFANAVQPVEKIFDDILDDAQRAIERLNGLNCQR